MRTLLLTLLMVTVAFAGCTDSGPETDTEGPSGGTGTANLDQKPDRRFEPELVLDATFLEAEPGDTVDLSYFITDLHDYDYPATFIDWTLTYNREATAIGEGDATDLPGDYTRTLYAEAWHVFKFSADDGQGFKSSKVLTIKVGDPPIPEVPVEDLAGPSDDPCEGVPAQSSYQAAWIVVMAGAEGIGPGFSEEFEIKPCQKVVDAIVHTTYSDIILALEDPSGNEVARNDADFVMSETLRYESTAPLEAGIWTLRVIPYAAGPDTIDIDIVFE